MHKVVKRNKRLMVIDKEDNIAYYPPDFLKRQYLRTDFEGIIKELDENGALGNECTKFEYKFNPRRKNYEIKLDA